MAVFSIFPNSLRGIASTQCVRLLSVLLIGFSPFVAPLKSAPASPEADRAWQVILEQAAGPGNRFHDKDEALTAAREHLDRQESALRNFEKAFPNDPRRFSARIRLASVLAAKSHLLKQPAMRAEAEKTLTNMESDPATPVPVKADAGFARVSQIMVDAVGLSDDATRDGLLKTVRKFDADYPGDRRTAGLLTELATLYDADPTRKKALLDEAATRTSDPALRQRIDDDLRRLSMLNRPVSLRLQPWQGGPAVDLASHRGRVVVIIFWASWSMPALRQFAQLEQTAQQFAGQPVDFFAVSLDEDRKALAATIEAANLRWPVYCDGRGWKGDLVRSVGINALPTVWVLDRRGNLLALNARGDEAADLIRKALAP